MRANHEPESAVRPGRLSGKAVRPGRRGGVPGPRSESGRGGFLTVPDGGQGLSRENLIGVRFVPLLPGQAREL